MFPPSSELVLSPQPFQRAVLRALSQADITVAGGSAGCGKSAVVSFAPIVPHRVDTPRFEAVCFRRTMPQVRQPGGLWSKSLDLYPHFGGVPREQTTSWRFPSGATVKYAHLQYDQDRYSWDGSEIALLMFDELQHFSEQQFWYMLGRNRTTYGFKPRCLATCNPDAGSFLRDLLDWWIGPDGLPVKDRAGVLRHFIRDDDGVLQWVAPDYLGPNGERAKSLTFIPGKVTDNPALLKANPGYMDQLRSLEPVERERLLYGNWNARAVQVGQIYREFNATRHFLSEAMAESLVLSDLQCWEGWDFGSGAMASTAVVWAYYNLSSGRLHVWDWAVEYEQTSEWWAQQVARHGYYTSIQRGRKPYRRLGDPAGRQRDSEQQHWFSNLARHGIELEPGVNRPNETIATMRWALRHDKIRLHPRLGQRLPIGPMAQGKRSLKSFADAFAEYVWNVPDEYDAAVMVRGGADVPRKNWASHPMDALGYIVRSIWGYVAEGMTALR